jgi:nucleoside-diphosphate-sugar epimerase
MNILITGGAGFFGSKLSEKLLDINHHVTVYDNLMYGDSGCQAFLKNPNYKLVIGDVTDFNKLNEVINSNDVVIHLAALVGEPACKKTTKENVYNINTESTKFISDICNQNNKQFIFLSTCSNYGKNTEVVNEDSELNPLGMYSDSKIKSENYIIENSKSYLILRCSTLFGVSHRMRVDLTINQFIYEGMRDGYISVFGEETWRPFLYVDDACDIIIQAMNKNLKGVYNIGEESLNFTKRDIVNNLKKCGLDFEVKYVDFDDPRDYKVDFSKLNSVLDYKINFDLEKGVKCIEDYLKNNWDSLSNYKINNN